MHGKKRKGAQKHPVQSLNPLLPQTHDMDPSFLSQTQQSWPPASSLRPRTPSLQPPPSDLELRAPSFLSQTQDSTGPQYTQDPPNPGIWRSELGTHHCCGRLQTHGAPAQDENQEAHHHHPGSRRGQGSLSFWGSKSPLPSSLPAAPETWIGAEKGWTGYEEPFFFF